MEENLLCTESLATLSNGQICYVNTIELQGLFKRRVFDLGLVPGTRVQCIRRGPCGNPIAFLVRGTMIALRKEDAEKIKVRIQ